MKKTLFTALLLAASISLYAGNGAALRDSILSVITGAPSQRHDAAPQRTVSITSFGAKGDGKADCKPAFDKAMKKARTSSQGLHIVVPQGKWFVKGPIHLTSNVTLELQRGATLLFSPNPKDYLPAVATSWEGSFCYNYSPFIYGYKLSNVAITGEGTIDGNCMETFPKWKTLQKADQQRLRRQDHEETPVDERRYGEGNYLRPHLVQFFDCKDITLSGVFITNSPFWCVHLLGCENVVCRGLRYDAKLVNNDGIDPEMTRNLLIEDIDFNNGDDNVAIKAGRDNDGWRAARPSENIIIRNCRFKGLHGVVIGSEMSAGVRNVFVEDCTYAGYVKRGLYIKTNPNRGGFIDNIYFSRCTFGEVEDLFYITSMYAGEGADDDHFTDVHDIHVADVTCQRANAAAIVLQGTEAKPLHDISFSNVNVREAATGYSSMNTLDITLRNCNLGGTPPGVPSQAK
ncbi:MAG: glycoside hydrolase family 28 protein [Prevotella sp.]|nr:glycoside hydrolase family 28 protein [Prevotella sp.]